MACVTVMCRPCAPLTDDMSSSIRVPPLFNRYVCVCVCSSNSGRERESRPETKKKKGKREGGWVCVCPAHIWADRGKKRMKQGGSGESTNLFHFHMIYISSLSLSLDIYTCAGWPPFLHAFYSILLFLSFFFIFKKICFFLLGAVWKLPSDEKEKRKRRRE